MGRSTLIVVLTLVACKTMRSTEREPIAKPPVIVREDLPADDLTRAEKAYAGDRMASFEQLADEAQAVAAGYLEKVGAEGLVAATEEELAFDKSMEMLTAKDPKEIAAGMAGPGLEQIVPETERKIRTQERFQEELIGATERTGMAPVVAGGGMSGSQMAFAVLGGALIAGALAGGFFCGRAPLFCGMGKCGRGAWRATPNLIAAVMAVTIIGGVLIWQATRLTGDPTAVRKARYRQMALLELSRIKLRRDALVTDLDRRGLRELGLSLGSCQRGFRRTEMDKPPRWNRADFYEDKFEVVIHNKDNPWKIAWLDKMATKERYVLFDLSDFPLPPGYNRSTTVATLDGGGDLAIARKGQEEPEFFFRPEESRWVSYREIWD